MPSPSFTFPGDASVGVFAPMAEGVRAARNRFPPAGPGHLHRPAAAPRAANGRGPAGPGPPALAVHSSTRACTRVAHLTPPATPLESSRGPNQIHKKSSLAPPPSRSQATPPVLGLPGLVAALHVNAQSAQRPTTATTAPPPPPRQPAQIELGLDPRRRQVRLRGAVDKLLG